MNAGLPSRIGIQQRVLPAYRAAFFDALARAVPGTLTVFAGAPEPQEGIPQAQSLQHAKWVRAENRRIGLGKLSVWRQEGWQNWIETEDPELVVLEANPRNLTNYSIQRRMHGRGRPSVGWSLGPTRYAGWLSVWMRPFYNRYGALIVYSRNGEEAFLRLGIPRSRIFVAPNAVESKTAESLLGRPNAREEARRRLGLDRRPTILFVGRLQPRKRLDLLLRVCARIGDSLQLLIVGDGPDRPRLERIAREAYPAARFAGDLRGEALGGCFLAADLFVLPGTGGLALQEAMLYGKPVAAAEADGSQRDLIREGENGWLLEPGDEDALLRVIREALSDPDRLNTMGEASRELVRRTATMEKMIDGFLRAIRFAAGSREQRT